MTFEAFVEAELPALARYARVLTGDRQRAHDVLADALVRAQTRWDRIGEMERPAAYVRRIVTTTFLSERRRWSTRHVLLTDTGDAPETPAPAPVSTEDRDELRRLLARLPRRQRAAIVLRFYVGLPDDEIVDELGCAAVTVRSHISRGLAALRIEAQHAESDEGADRAGWDTHQGATGAHEPGRNARQAGGDAHQTGGNARAADTAPARGEAR